MNVVSNDPIMWNESTETTQPLKTGLTTGSCATACCVAAAQALLADKKTPVVSITLPKGKTVELTIEDYQQQETICRTSTIKDAGDDPDVTHGATVFVELGLSEQKGIHFIAGAGVGTVTREGLELNVGEPAINPVPRQMMIEHLQKIANRYHYKEGFNVTVGIINGEVIAKKTMNPRLGIVGGLSVLGTTGIVRPFSCAAWIASIHQSIDVAKANGCMHIAASTGNKSEQAIKTHYQLSDMALIEMGDFAGGVLKYLKKVPIKKMSLCGGFGKISKLANGHLDLNSRASSIDFHHLADLAKGLGATQALQQSILTANTSMEAYKLCQQENIELGNRVCSEAWLQTRRRLPDSVAVEIWAVDRQGKFIGFADKSLENY